MKHIKKFKKIFPLQVGNLTIRIIEEQDIRWYIDNIKSDYYNEYSDYKYTPEYEDFIENKIQNIVKLASLGVDSPDELRFTLEVNGKQAGGFSINELNSNTLKVSYFITPDNQHKSLAYTMLNELIKTLRNTKYKYIMANIQCINEHSIKLVERLGFKEVQRYQGVKCEVIRYEVRIH